MLAGDPWMAHSLLSAPMNLGLLDPLEVVRARPRTPTAPATRRSRRVEGFVRQIIGWRDYVWHLYWHLGESYRRRNALQRPTRHVPDWFAELDADGGRRRAACRTCCGGVREHGWVHHIPRLMVLGNYAMQRGWRPAAGHRLVPPRVRRRLRLGDGAQRRRHVAARRRRR